jgi:predicted amidohydrolase
MSDPYDLLLIGGTLVNPATGIHQPMDVGVTGGRIAQIAPSLAQESAKKIWDVHGGYVTPGLIDFLSTGG